MYITSTCIPFNYTQCIWGKLYSPRSSANKGTLFQLRNLLHRTQVTKDVKSNVFTTEDLLEVITQGHVLAAAMTVKSVTKLEDLSLTESEKIASLSERIVDTFVAPIFFGEMDLPSDKVAVYAMELMLMGLLWYGFKDAISEGDGPVVMSYWKVKTIMFRPTNHSK